MMVNQLETDLKEAISKLESALLTPVIAGELLGWVTAVQDTADDLAEQFRAFADQVLHPQYKEIGKADNELLFRVQQLKEEEVKLLTAHEEFRRNLHLLAQRAPQVGEDEAKVADERAQVEKQGMKLMTELKRQQLAATTWLSEAVYRDRGPVD
jgi:chromosome segregation ATPase